MQDLNLIQLRSGSKEYKPCSEKRKFFSFPVSGRLAGSDQLSIVVLDFNVICRYPGRSTYFSRLGIQNISRVGRIEIINNHAKSNCYCAMRISSQLKRTINEGKDDSTVR